MNESLHMDSVIGGMMMIRVKKQFKVMICIFIYLMVINLVAVNGKAVFGASTAPPDLLSNIFTDQSIAGAVASQLGIPTSTSVTQAELDKITFLTVINKNVTDLSGIGYLRKLEYLDISNNLIESLPQEMGNLSFLKTLSLSSNRITMLPSNLFGLFTSLEKIMLDNNKISDISELANLPSNCIKNCTSQIDGIQLGTLDTNKPYTIPVQLPKLYSSQTISVSANPNQEVTITTDASGNKQVNVPVGILGQNTVTVRIENGIAAYSTFTIMYNVTNSYQLKIPVINPVLNNSYTTNLKPLIYGTGIPGTSVMVTIDGKSDANTVVVNTSGYWSYEPTSNLTQGKHVVTAKAKDISNTWSGNSAAVSITIDTTAPMKPVITAALNNSFTNNGRIPITGTAEANTWISLNIDLVDLIDCTKTDSTGKWSYIPTTAFSSGIHTIIAKARDMAGNSSAFSSSVKITIDTVPPTIPIIDPFFNGALLNNSKPSVYGVGEIGSKILLYVDGTFAPNAVVVDATGKWKYTLGTALTDGSHIISAIAKDNAGNSSNTSTSYAIMVDTIVPKAPLIQTPGNSAVLNTAKPIVSGKSELNTSVIVFVDGKAISNKLTVDNLGNWSYIPVTAIADGVRKITAKAYDIANNESTLSTIATITIKTASPPPPVINTKLNNLVTNNRRPVISGTAEAKAYITVNVDGVDFVDCVIADEFGKWAYTPGTILADGRHVVSARARDIFHNVGAFSPNTYIVIDTLPPNVPTIDASFNGAILNSVKPEIFGTAEPSADVFVYIGGVMSKKSVKADSSGKWKFIPEANLMEGSHQINAKAVDTAGNSSNTSPVLLVSINVTPPKPPRILQPGNNFITNNTTIVISGLSELNTKVFVYAGQIELGSVDTDGAGNWLIQSSGIIKDGKHSITAKARNKANNTSPASPAISITVDTTAPKPPVITFPTNYLTTNNLRVMVSGTAEASTKITVKIDDKVYSDCTTADSSGRWSYHLDALLAPGTHAISASAKDGMNNIGTFGNPIYLVIDQTSPIVVFGEIGTGNVTNSQQPTITGSVKPNAKVYLRLDDKEIAIPVMADNEGAWKFKVTTKLVEGSHTVSGRAVDSAGNESTASAAAKFIVDLTAPATPEIKVPDPKEKVVANNPNPEISGKGEPDSIVSILIDRKVQEEAVQVDGEGNWVFMVSNTLSDGSHMIQAVAKDLAGNASKQSEPLTVLIDTVAPEVPKLSMPLSKAVYKSSSVLIQGQGEKGASLVVLVDNKLLETNIILDGSGNFSYVLNKGLTAGKHVIAVALKDAAQNLGSANSVEINIELEKQKIKTKTPIVTSPANNFKTKEKRPYIKGKTSPNANVTVTISTTKTIAVQSIKSDKNGVWSIRLKKNLAPGKYKISVSAQSSGALKAVGKTVVFQILK